VAEFLIDGRGRLVFLREEDGGGASLVIVDQQGTRLREVKLPAAALYGYDRWPQFAWTGGDRFVVTNSGHGVNAKAAAWCVDAAAGEVKRIPDFECPAIDKVVGLRDGRFVVLATERSKYTSSTTAYMYDDCGRRVWTLPHDDLTKPDHLFAPEAVAVTSGGEIAVLDVIRKDVAFFTRAGVYRTTLDLESASGRRFGYPTKLLGDRDGGLIVGDGAGGRLVRLSADGTVRQEVTPKYADGRESTWLHDVRVAPDGRLWTSDGYAILRLDQDGRIDRVLGELPDPRRLDHVEAVAVDGRGRILAMAGRTWAVHIFDAAGRPLHVCRPRPADFPDDAPAPVLTAKDTGDVYLSRNHGRNYLHFSPDGKRLGFERLKPDDIRERWLFQPGSTRRWELGDHKVLLVDGAKGATRTITRRPDGRWLDDLRHAAVGRDGSLAVTSGSYLRPREPVTVSLYTRDGEPLRTIGLPGFVSLSHRFDYDGERLVVTGKGKVALFDRSGRPVQQFSPVQAGNRETWGQPMLRPRERQLLLFDGDRTVYRYELP
jgi:sugar lactone lactonase YvrE